MSCCGMFVQQNSAFFQERLLADAGGKRGSCGSLNESRIESVTWERRAKILRIFFALALDSFASVYSSEIY